ncbi:hypothetical protein [Mucilaginibacter xinganensis]|uniref:Uncharacterized protein n=1 Tax=Mucilaginibacter xinganensis TaxID=1234841 RepID=A0A223NXR9_9SPHI|nr:hypothetical protein [Mucilaginibacter xinganensis]ASU34361.1 hypothetical protein MuYL_2474 [Mucilaginibacter xinganensis]
METQSNTKITTASVRVMQSFNYSNFEVSMSLENPDGVTQLDIDQARMQAQALTNKAVRDYQEDRQIDIKQGAESERKKLLGKIGDIKASIPKREITDPSEVEKIANLPLYTPPAKKAISKKPVTKKVK